MTKNSKEFHGKIFELTLALYRVTDFFPQGEILKRHLREKANEIFGSIAEYGYSGDLAREATALLARIQAMKGYLSLAQAIRFVRPINITVLMREYSIFEQFFNTELNDLKRDRNGNEANGHTKDKGQTDILTKAGVFNGHKKSTAEENFAAKDTGIEKPVNNVDTMILDRASVKNNEFVSLLSEINERQKLIIGHIEKYQKVKISDLFPYFSEVSSKTIQRDLHDLVEKNILRKEGEKKWTVYSLRENTRALLI